MWPWSNKSCPLDPTTRAWLDKRWRWLTEEFGDSVLLEFPQVLPTHWDADTRRWPGTDQPATTYMTGAMLGYALALRCCQRMESLPAWRKYINPGVRAEFKQSYRFLDK